MLLPLQFAGSLADVEVGARRRSRVVVEKAARWGVRCIVFFFLTLVEVVQGCDIGKKFP